MAAPALRGGSQKHTLYMTGITTDKRMCKIQRENGFIVIKGLRGFSRLGINPACCQ